MEHLEPEAFDRARSHIADHARELDRARYGFHFEEGPASDVIAALAGYQNADGGFGNALEPDFRLPDSSPMATSHGFHVLLGVGAGAEEDHRD